MADELRAERDALAEGWAGANEREKALEAENGRLAEALERVSELFEIEKQKDGQRYEAEVRAVVEEMRSPGVFPRLRSRDGTLIVRTWADRLHAALRAAEQEGERG